MKERHEYSDYDSVGNGNGVDNGQREEGEEEIGSWFPLLDLFWDYGQLGISPTEDKVGSEEGGGVAEDVRGIAAR